jgi:predicted RNA-binding protein with RPS1 domain
VSQIFSLRFFHYDPIQALRIKNARMLPIGDKRLIRVAMVGEGSAPAQGSAGSKQSIVPEARLVGKVDRHEKSRVFVFLAPGRTGLIPLSETGVTKGSDVQKTFPVGADVEVIVLEVDPSDRRIRLSAKAIAEARDAEEVREWTERQAPAEGSGVGTLADKLRAALNPKK